MKVKYTGSCRSEHQKNPNAPVFSCYFLIAFNNNNKKMLLNRKDILSHMNQYELFQETFQRDFKYWND